MSTNGSIEERVREYLANGGLFNPELMDHKAARRQQVAANKLPLPQRTRPMFAPKEATNEA